ncbi:MerR family transcriptional regulator [Helicobacter pametensis]|uniref:MerR family transcriptional regulator n=1 Tax=Helicobacter pametensis TaxID=95149 RepID=UPI0004803A3E|nr:MerR family transcriptional regulator [Helicobacter pametensis]
MAYRIKEVEQITGISSHTLRFWAKKGLFPFVQKDRNGVKYFSNSDLEWVKLIACLRSVDMGIEEIEEYIKLCQKGFQTAQLRREMLHNKKTHLLQKIQNLQNSLEHLQYKISYYDEMLKQNQDSLNPLSHQKISNQCQKNS